MDMPWIVYAGIALFFAVASAIIGDEKLRCRDGFILGLMLGPIGLIITILLDNRRESKCPRCQKDNLYSHAFCCHCGADMKSKIVSRCPHCDATMQL
jgi:hypothetical protein